MENIINDILFSDIVTVFNLQLLSAFVERRDHLGHSPETKFVQ